MADGKNPRVKGILCNSKGYPLKFDDQMSALQFWMNNKTDFDIDSKFINARGTPQVVREGEPGRVLFDQLRNNERIAIYPTTKAKTKVDQMSYVEPTHYPVWIRLTLLQDSEVVIGVLCGDDKLPLWFLNETEASLFWDKYKDQFDLRDRSIKSVDCIVSNDTYPEDELIDKISEKEYVVVSTFETLSLYSDCEQGTSVFNDAREY